MSSPNASVTQPGTHLADVRNALFCYFLMGASNPHALDFADADIVVAAVIEAGGFCVRVPGHALRDLEFPPIRQVVGNAGGAEGMAADGGF